MFQSLEAVAAAIATIEGLYGPFTKKVFADLLANKRGIELSVQYQSSHGEVIYGAGGTRRFLVKGDEKTGYTLVMSRHHTDASLRDLQDKGSISRPAIERAEQLGVKLV